MYDPLELKKAIRETALAEGFSAVGFTNADTDLESKKNLDAYLAAGLHGQMGWMAEKADRRGEPQVLWPEARSIIVLAMNYGPAQDPLAIHDRRDLGAMLNYQPFTGAVRYREAGVEWIARHGLDVTPDQVIQRVFDAVEVPGGYELQRVAP